MPQLEQHGRRVADDLYSAFHRIDRIGRFLSERDARRLCLIDIDQQLTTGGLRAGITWVECHDRTYEPIALIETVLEGAQKSTQMLQRLASGKPRIAFCVWITPTDDRCDIARFRVQQVWPHNDKEWVFTPEGYASFLLRLRRPVV